VEALATATGPASTAQELTDARTIVTQSQDAENYTPLVDAVPADYTLAEAEAAIEG
jgi:hypothetical protein